MSVKHRKRDREREKRGEEKDGRRKRSLLSLGIQERGACSLPVFGLSRSSQTPSIVTQTASDRLQCPGIISVLSQLKHRDLDLPWGVDPSGSQGLSPATVPEEEGEERGGRGRMREHPSVPGNIKASVEL